MELNSFEDLFVYLLCDIYDVENQIVKEMPRIIKKVYSDKLKIALQDHLAETKKQVVRLDRIFNVIRQKPKKVEWAQDVRALFHDADVFLNHHHPSPLLDAAIIAFLQRVEHIEIATYGTLREFASVLGVKEIGDILKETLKEEGHADTILSKLAKGGVFNKGINVEATH